MLDHSSWNDIPLPANLQERGIYIGTAGFEFSDWVGRFYPTRHRESRAWFKFYQEYFSFLEIGHTFYQVPQLQQFMELERSSKTSMRFSVKVHGDISHKGIWELQQGEALMQKHVEAVSPIFETGRFYSFLIQLDHSLERSRKIQDYLLSTASVAIAHGLDVHIEFRNRTWHQESVLQSLKDAGIGICNTEIPDIPGAFPLKAYATSQKGYVRYHGLNQSAWMETEVGASFSPAERQQIIQSRSDYFYSRQELEVRRAGQLALIGKVDTTAVVFTNHVEAKGVLNAIEAIKLLNDTSN